MGTGLLIFLTVAYEKAEMLKKNNVFGICGYTVRSKHTSNRLLQSLTLKWIEKGACVIAVLSNCFTCRGFQAATTWFPKKVTGQPSRRNMPNEKSGKSERNLHFVSEIQSNHFDVESSMEAVHNITSIQIFHRKTKYSIWYCTSFAPTDV